MCRYRKGGITFDSNTCSSYYPDAMIIPMIIAVRIAWKNSGEDC